MIKRTFDIIASFFGLLLLWPVLLLISLLIKIKMPEGPILFKQERIGRFAKQFTMVKFRTMTVNHSGSSISVKGEHRITPFGSFLRKYKLDELPELWNVFVGDMSFVGPRPDVPGYADKLIGEERKILEFRPGITGPASLKYANEEELLTNVANPKKFNDEVIYPDKVRLNLEYLRTQTFWGDIIIIFRTIFGKRDI